MEYETKGKIPLGDISTFALWKNDELWLMNVSNKQKSTYVGNNKLT